MMKDETLEYARFIFTTGKMIHDRVFLIKSAHFALGKNGSVFSELSMAQFRALMLVRMREHVSIKDLAAQLGVSPPSVSVMVDRLVEKKLLIRKTSQKDRRKVDISLSPKVLENFEILENAVFQEFVALVEKIGPEVAKKWCEVLRKLKVVIEEEDKEMHS